jgi:hypothetical protein
MLLREEDILSKDESFCSASLLKMLAREYEETVQWH